LNLVLSESKWLRIGSMTIFYVAQGLPIGLFTIAMAAWLPANGQSAGAVAALITAYYLPWSYKFLVAPIMDRYTYLPMGRRRIWLIGSQAVILFGLGYAAFTGPTPDQTGLLNLLAFVVASCGAMQDVAVDGLAVDILPEDEQGPVSAFTLGGQALGMAAGGAAGGYLLDNYGSSVAFLAFMPLNLIFLLLASVLREHRGEKLLPWTAGQPSAVTLARADIAWMEVLSITVKSLAKRDSIVMMIAQAFGRAGGGVFIAFWPFFATTQAGWSTAAYSGMVGTVGLICSVACMFIGSFMVSFLGPRLSTVIAYAGYGIMALVFLIAPKFAFIGSVFVILSIYWNMTDTLTSACSGALRMRLSDKRVAATQFTVYNSLSNLPVPLGTSLFAWAMGAGGVVVLMPSVVTIIAICCIGYGMMRVGGRGEHLDQLEPRLD
jgi:PAT family beta-lactamase induction signal transducer AmpG